MVDDNCVNCGLPAPPNLQGLCHGCDQRLNQAQTKKRGCLVQVYCLLKDASEVGEVFWFEGLKLKHALSGKLEILN